MLTRKQLIRFKRNRHPKVKKSLRSRALLGCPQKRGVCFKIRTMKPKKPNSAVRKIAKVTLSTMRKVSCYIPGIGHELIQHSKVLVRGGHVPDLPGIQYHLVKGKYDFSWKERICRSNRRSKYGVPRDQNQNFYR